MTTVATGTTRSGEEIQTALRTGPKSPKPPGDAAVNVDRLDRAATPGPEQPLQPPMSHHGTGADPEPRRTVEVVQLAEYVALICTEWLDSSRRWANGTPSRRAILFLSGLRCDRQAPVVRAALYGAAGWSSLS